MDPKLSFKSKSKFNWDDVQKVPQYEGQPTILNLKYKPECKCLSFQQNHKFKKLLLGMQIKDVELMDYFRAIVKSNEFSERSFELSGFVLEMLTSNYNAYHIRRQCLETLKLSYENELLYIGAVIEGNPKTYQAWEHRRYIVETLKKCDGEIDFLETCIFSDDNKNYHGWGYRIWLCQQFNLYEDEWKRIQKYFKEDIRNNSAWNYRHFLLSQRILKSKEDFANELLFIFESIKQVPDNESAWNYLMGWFTTFEFSSLKSQDIVPGEKNIFNKKWIFSFNDFPQVQAFSDELLVNNAKNRYLLYLRIQLIITKKEPTQEELQQACDVCEFQGAEADKIRINYWNWFKDNIRKDFKLV